MITWYLHPVKTITERYVNFSHRDQTSNLVCIRNEDKVVNCCTQTVAVFQHANFNDTEIHAVVCWVTAEQEGCKEDIFLSQNPVALSEGEGASHPSEINEGQEATVETAIPDNVFNSTG